MVENDWEVMAFAYAGEDGTKDWNVIGEIGITANGFCRYVSEGHVTWDWWDHIAILLRNGQIIRVKKKEPK